MMNMIADSPGVVDGMPVLTFSLTNDGRFFHWKNGDSYAKKLAHARRCASTTGGLVTKWRRVIRAAMDKGQSCQVQLIVGYAKEPVVEKMTIRVKGIHQ